MSQLGFAIDGLFGLLQDLRWHEVPEVVGALSLPTPNAEKILEFLGRFNFIEYDGKKARIDQKRLEWLRATEKNLL
jgi:hypothetical protein